MSNTIAAARIRIAIVVDPGGNWAAAGWRGARDAEAIEAATLSTPVNSDGAEQQHYWVTVELPLPRAFKLFHAADVEPFEPTEAEEDAEDYRGEVGRQLAAVEDWAAKRAAENKEFKEKVAGRRTVAD